MDDLVRGLDFEVRDAIARIDSCIHVDKVNALQLAAFKEAGLSEQQMSDFLLGNNAYYVQEGYHFRRAACSNLCQDAYRCDAKLKHCHDCEINYPNGHLSYFLDLVIDPKGHFLYDIYKKP